MEISPDSLRERYRAYSDEALLEAAASGPESYSPAAWSIIQELLASRALSSARASDQTAPSTSPPIQTAPAPHISRYFILSRLRGQQWPVEVPLPLAGRDVIAVLALLSGALGFLLLLLALAFLESPLETLPNIATLILVSTLSLLFAYSANRPASPWTWRVAILYVGVAPLLAALRTIAEGALSISRVLLSLLASTLWLLYFARRRALYQLPPWSSVL
jgi:hypothetical protein